MEPLLSIESPSLGGLLNLTKTALCGLITSSRRHTSSVGRFENDWNNIETGACDCDDGRSTSVGILETESARFISRDDEGVPGVHCDEGRLVFGVAE